MSKTCSLKYTNAFSILALVILYTSCLAPSEKRIKDKRKMPPYSQEDMVIVEKDVFLIDSAFYPHLDTMIQNEVECPGYSKANTFFKIYFSKENDTLSLLMGSGTKQSGVYFDCFGVFFYKGYRFNCMYEHPEELEGNILTFANKKVKFEIVDQEKIVVNIDDSKTTVCLIYVKNKISVLYKRECTK